MSSSSICLSLIFTAEGDDYFPTVDDDDEEVPSSTASVSEHEKGEKDAAPEKDSPATTVDTETSPECGGAKAKKKKTGLSPKDTRGEASENSTFQMSESDVQARPDAEEQPYTAAELNALRDWCGHLLHEKDEFVALVSKLRRQLDIHQTCTNRYRDEIRDLKDKLEEKSDQAVMKRLFNEERHFTKNAVEANRAESRTKIESFAAEQKRKNAAVEAKMESFDVTVEVLGDRERKLLSEMEDKEEALAEAATEKKALEEQLASAYTQLLTKNEALREAKEYRDELEDKMRNLTDRYAQVHVESMQHEQTISELREKEAETTAKVDALEAELKAEQYLTFQAQEKITQLQEEVKTVKQESAETEEKLLDELKVTKDQVEVLEKRVRFVKHELALKEDENVRLKTLRRGKGKAKNMNIDKKIRDFFKSKSDDEGDGGDSKEAAEGSKKTKLGGTLKR